MNEEQNIEEIKEILDEDEEILWRYSHKARYGKKHLKTIQIEPPITLEEIRPYFDTYVLTNKRWIQKDLSYYCHTFVFPKFPKDKVERFRDIISVRFEYLALINIVDTISVYMVYEFDEKEMYCLGVDVPKKEHKDIISVLKTIKAFKFKESRIRFARPSYNDTNFYNPLNLRSFIEN